LFLIVCAVGLAAFAIFYAAFLRADEEQVPDDEAPVVELTPADPSDLVTVRNKHGGYVFDRPKSWRARKEGSATTAFPRDRSVIVTFGRAPNGALRSASSKLLEEVVRSYEDPAVREQAQLDTIGEYQALTIAGEGTTKKGNVVNFLVIAIDAGRRNFGVTVFTPAGSDPIEVLPDVQQVVSSFRLL
jgi:hypothetical protein